MKCMAQTIKYILYIFNFAFLICGIFLITFGGLLLRSLEVLNVFNVNENSEALPICIVVLGCVLFLVSFFGCFGIVRENIYCIYLYFAFMLILFGLEITLIIFMSLTHDQYVHSMIEVVSNAWNSYMQTNNTIMDLIQIQYKCCGFNGYEDFIYHIVPNSCCGLYPYDTDEECPADVYTNRPGCYNQFYHFWSTNADVLIFSGIGIAFVELVVLIFFYALITSFRKSDNGK